jgi:hypothetical protein
MRMMFAPTIRSCLESPRRKSPRPKPRANARAVTLADVSIRLAGKETRGASSFRFTMALPQQSSTEGAGMELDGEALDGLLGQISALSLTLTAVITSLPADCAAKAATSLRISLDVERERDEIPPTRESALIGCRDQIAEAYLDLLKRQTRL